MTNYFGRAFVVRSPGGEELVRFVENGNVLLMKEGATVCVGFEDWESLGTGNQFIVQNVAQEKKAVVTPEGDMYLAGAVMESQTGPLDPEDGGTGFQIVRSKDQQVVSLIDDHGNLKMLRDENAPDSGMPTGYLLVDGIPWNLRTHQTTDHYFAH